MSRHIVRRKLKMPRKTKEQIMAEKQRVRNIMSEGSNTDDTIKAVLICMASNSGTYWERKISPYFIVCNTLKINAVVACTNDGINRETLGEDHLVRNNWVIPKLTRPHPFNLKEDFKEAYSMLVKAWELERVRIQTENTYKAPMARAAGGSDTETEHEGAINDGNNSQQQSQR